VPNTPTDAAARKALPIVTGVLDYFPDALLAVAEVSRVGNDQHNPGQPLHWEKGLSTDHADSLVRHLIDRGTFDTDGTRHSAKVAWRALAQLQVEIERELYEDEPLPYSLPSTNPRLPLTASEEELEQNRIRVRTLEDGYAELQRQKAQEDRG
jgi:hypothetical protein